jgi:hypothetical protein
MSMTRLLLVPGSRDVMWKKSVVMVSAFDSRNYMSQSSLDPFYGLGRTLLLAARRDIRSALPVFVSEGNENRFSDVVPGPAQSACCANR